MMLKRCSTSGEMMASSLEQVVSGMMVFDFLKVGMVLCHVEGNDVLPCDVKA